MKRVYLELPDDADETPILLAAVEVANNSGSKMDCKTVQVPANTTYVRLERVYQRKEAA